jgi:hypothetical protein
MPAMILLISLFSRLILGYQVKPYQINMVKNQARLYSRAVFMGFRGGRTTQSENQAILKLEGVGTKSDAAWYLGKRVAYVYRAKKARKTFDKHESK